MIAKLRTGLFWLHLCIGVAAALFILSMAVSGMLIAYERPLTAWAERGQHTVNVPAGTARLGVEEMTAKVQAVRPDARLAGVTLYADSAAAAMFNVGRDDVLYVNPYTGDVLGEGSKSARAFFRFVTGWHRWLATEGPTRPVGQAITGAAAIAYFVLLLTGVCLWLPRHWSWNNLKRIALFKRGLQGKARDWNWHNVVGIWCAPVLLFVTLTGIIMAYPWASNLLFRLSGSPPPEQRREGGRQGEDRDAKPDLKGVDALWVQAEQKVEGWQSINLRFASSPRAPAVFNIDRGDGARPDLKAQLTVDRRTGAETRWQPYADQSTGQKLRFWARFVHTGEAGGWFGETVAVVASAGGVVLIWTGLSLAWRRFRGRRGGVAETATS